MKTEWKIFNRNTNYEVSSLGEVRVVGSLMRRKPRFDEHMYMRINLGINKTYSVHRMVAETFLEKIEGKDFVNHKNNIPWDNRVENLEWCTHAENMKHSSVISAHYNGENVHTVKLTEEQARQIKYFDNRSSTTIGKELNVDRSTIQKIRSGKTWKHI
jgi:hypothetical protein